MVKMNKKIISLEKKKEIIKLAYPSNGTKSIRQTARLYKVQPVQIRNWKKTFVKIDSRLIYSTDILKESVLARNLANDKTRIYNFFDLKQKNVTKVHTKSLCTDIVDTTANILGFHDHLYEKIKLLNISANNIFFFNKITININQHLFSDIINKYNDLNIDNIDIFNNNIQILLCNSNEHKTVPFLLYDNLCNSEENIKNNLNIINVIPHNTILCGQINGKLNDRVLIKWINDCWTTVLSENNYNNHYLLFDENVYISKKIKNKLHDLHTVVDFKPKGFKLSI